MELIAHRGSSGRCPENTLAAFRQAVADGVAMIEFDVRRTADGTLVVHHDRRLGRTAAGRGALWRWRWKDLRHVDAGSWFDHRYAGERIPRLRDVLRDVPVSVALNVEVKTDGDPRDREPFEEALVHELARDRRGRRVIVSSFDHRFLRGLKRRAPHLEIGALSMPLRDAARGLPRLARRLGASTIICSRTRLRRRLVRDAHRHGLRVLVYNVNTSRHLSRVLRFGADGIMTDHPAQLARRLRPPDLRR